jgi:ATP-binding cassette, subfamily F, member 3
MIEFKNVSKHYGPQDVLIDANVRILSGDRLGVVGPNGTGKTTLFRLITGESTADKGEVLVQSGIRIGYLRQVLNHTGTGTTLIDYVADAIPELRVCENRLHEIEHQLEVRTDHPDREKLIAELGRCQTQFEHLGGYTLRARAESALGGLGFAADTLADPIASFSGGWQMRGELARVLIAGPDILLLDEPSNYLDLPAVEWLQRFLRAYQGTLVLISHDRYLLNTLTQDTLEINAGRCTLYRGRYDEYMQARQARHEQLQSMKKNQDQKRKQVERFVERFRAKNTKATQVQSRIKMLEKMDVIELPDEITTRGRIRIAAPPHCGAEIMRLENAGVTYDQQNWVLRHVDLAIQRGEKTALVGMNGLGKTTLLRLLAGALPLSEGTRTLGHRVQPGYQTQDFAESMSPSQTAFETVRAMAPDMHEQQIRTLLGGFGFSGDAIEKTVAVLSGGEKIRLAFARLLIKPPNFLILDEPTTHLDIHARETLEEALIAYEGTLYFVSHDVEFVQRIATGIIAMTPPGITRYLGNYDYYKEKTGTAPQLSATAPATGGSDRKEQKRQRAQQVRETAALKRQLEKTMRAAEERIARLEAEQQELLEDIDPGGRKRSFAEINQRLTEIPARIEACTKEWEEAALALEELDP